MVLNLQKEYEEKTPRDLILVIRMSFCRKSLIKRFSSYHLKTGLSHTLEYLK